MLPRSFPYLFTFKITFVLLLLPCYFPNEVTALLMVSTSSWVTGTSSILTHERQHDSHVFGQFCTADRAQVLQRESDK